MCQKNKDRLKKRFQSLSIYNTMQSVFATISMALRGSTISLSLSFLRTQSGANLEHGGGRRRKKKEEMSGVTAANVRQSHPRRSALAYTYLGGGLDLRGVAGT